MKRAGFHLVFGGVMLALALAFLVYLGLPRTRATGGPLVALVLLSAASLSYGLYRLSAAIAERKPSGFAWAGETRESTGMDRPEADEAARKRRCLARIPTPGINPSGNKVQLSPATTIWSHEVSVPEVSRLGFRMAGRRQILSPRDGLAIVVGSDRFEAIGFTFSVTVYSHGKFIGLESFPSISSPEFAGMKHVDLGILGPIGKWGLPRNLDLFALLRHPRDDCLDQIELPAGGTLSRWDVMADILPFFFVLEQWREHMNGELPQTITMPAPLASLVRQAASG